MSDGKNRENNVRGVERTEDGQFSEGTDGIESAQTHERD